MSAAWSEDDSEALDRAILASRKASLRRVKVAGDTDHGKVWMYNNGCRCPTCRAAKSAYKRERRSQGLSV